MSIPIAVQLYTVRDELARDFEGTLRRVAEMGYTAIETGNYSPAELPDKIKLFHELGLKVVSMHGGLPLGDEQSQVIEAAQALGSPYIVIPWQSPDNFQSEDAIKALCERMNQASANAQAHGLTLGYHNHWFELAPVGNSFGLELMLKHLDPSVIFEIDTYWVKTGGRDPVAIIEQFGKRAPLLHIKDGPAVPDMPMVAVGDGVLDFPSIIQKAEGSAHWLIVELDSCATDMLQAVEKSYRYLIDHGLAHNETR